MSVVVRSLASSGMWVAPGRPDVPAGDRSSLVPGTYLPTESLTGTLFGIGLTQVTGDLVVTTPGAVLRSLRITGRLVIRAAGVRAYGCEVLGGAATGNAGLIDCTSQSCLDFVAEDCTLVPSVPSYWWNPVIGHDYTLRRCQWKWTVDGPRGYDTVRPGRPLHCRVEACWGGPLTLFQPDPNHANTDNRTHNDGFQIESGMAANHSSSTPSTWLTPLTDIADASYVALGNAIYGSFAGGVDFPETWPGFDPSTSDPLSEASNSEYLALRDATTSLFQVTPNLGVPVTGLWLERNWFFGSAIGVSLAGGGGSTQRWPGTFVDNIFDGQQRIADKQGTDLAWCFSVHHPTYGDKTIPQVHGTYTGNTNVASGGAARIARSG